MPILPSSERDRIWIFPILLPSRNLNEIIGKNSCTQMRRMYNGKQYSLDALIMDTRKGFG
jgi:hypothetical protein